jgi:hypothetical protein
LCRVFLFPIFRLATQERLNAFVQSVLLKGAKTYKCTIWV